MPFLIPHRSSRHRAACFALHRALLRSVRAIPFPAESAGEQKEAMTYMVLRQFRKNRRDVSPRLVYSALSTGYKFLSLFSKAKIEGSPEHKSVLDYVQEAIRHRDAIRSTKPPPPGPRTLKPGGVPLLTRLPPESDDPTEIPRYVSEFRPRPKSELRGRRTIPRMGYTAIGNIPFLRFGENQPVAHSLRLERENEAMRCRAAASHAILNDWMPAAADEDAWERRLRALAWEKSQEEGVALSPEEEQMMGDRRRASYQDTLNDALVTVLEEANAMRRDFIGRARAMVDLIKQEKALLAVEDAEEQRPPAKRRGVWNPTPPGWKGPSLVDKWYGHILYKDAKVEPLRMGRIPGKRVPGLLPGVGTPPPDKEGTQDQKDAGKQQGRSDVQEGTQGQGEPGKGQDSTSGEKGIQGQEEPEGRQGDNNGGEGSTGAPTETGKDLSKASEAETPSIDSTTASQKEPRD